MRNRKLIHVNQINRKLILIVRTFVLNSTKKAELSPGSYTTEFSVRVKNVLITE